MWATVIFEVEIIRDGGAGYVVLPCASQAITAHPQPIRTNLLAARSIIVAFGDILTRQVYANEGYDGSVVLESEHGTETSDI